MFKNALRDFLISVKEFSAEDNEDLYEEERSAEMGQQADQKRAAQLAIPGMVNPNDEGLMDDDL